MGVKTRQGGNGSSCRGRSPGGWLGNGSCQIPWGLVLQGNGSPCTSILVGGEVAGTEGEREGGEQGGEGNMGLSGLGEGAGLMRCLFPGGRKPSNCESWRRRVGSGFLRWGGLWASYVGAWVHEWSLAGLGWAGTDPQRARTGSRSGPRITVDKSESAALALSSRVTEKENRWRLRGDAGIR